MTNAEQQHAQHVDQQLLQSKLIDIIILAYNESSMTYDQLKTLAAGCGISMADLQSEAAQIIMNEEKEPIANITPPVPYTDWNNPNF